MPLSHFEHCLVVTDDMDRTRDWYRAVLGMEQGPHQDFGFPVHWLYLNGRDVVPGLGFKRPTWERAVTMARTLQQRGVLTKLRNSVGQDIDGGCG